MTYYAFRVSPQKERAAEEALRKRGFDPFVPVEKRFLRRMGKQRKKVERFYPLLIGYVLVPLSTPLHMRAIFSLDVIKSVVGFGGVPAPIKDSAITSLRHLHGSEIQDSRNNRASFSRGETVRITTGPFRDRDVVVEMIKGERARVLLGLLELDVKLDALEAA